jgi:hypothetical protein
MADSSVVNTNLTGPGYAGDSNLRYVFNGEGCGGQDFYASTGDSNSQSRPSCSWNDSHHWWLFPDSLVQGIMCQMN